MLTAAHLADIVATLTLVEHLDVNPTPEEVGRLRALAKYNKIVINVWALNAIPVPVDLTDAKPAQQVPA